jgi:hypothetical protein
VAIEASDLVAWAKAFAFTELVEMPIYRSLVPSGWGAAFAASALTHPFVWFVFPWLGRELGLEWTVTALASELFAFAVEAAFFRRVCKVSWRRAALVSLLANAASLALGLTVRATLGIV